MINKTHLKRLFRKQFQLENQLNELDQIEKITTCGHCSPTYQNARHMLKVASNSIDEIIDSYLDAHEEVSEESNE